MTSTLFRKPTDPSLIRSTKVSRPSAAPPVTPRSCTTSSLRYLAPDCCNCRNSVVLQIEISAPESTKAWALMPSTLLLTAVSLPFEPLARTSAISTGSTSLNRSEGWMLSLWFRKSKVTAWRSITSRPR